MIHVSAGSPNSISLELYLSFLSGLPKKIQKNYCLHIDPSFLADYSKKVGLNYNDVNVQPLTAPIEELCMTSLSSAISHLSSKDVLFNLPANKDEIVYKTKPYMGHTEFLRHLWEIPELPMSFLAPGCALLLLTDHVPLKQVPHFLKRELIIKKVNLFLHHYPNADHLKRIVFWGLNPHAGENGLLGNEELEISLAINTLKSQHPSLNFLGPRPSDGNFSLKANTQSIPDELIVSCYHDQGLVFFKSTYGFLGANCTFSGKNLRLSPDHGTAKDLLYQRKGIYSSLLWCHQLLLHWGAIL